MIKLKTLEEIKRIRESCIIVSELLLSLKSMVVEGITTKEIDLYVRSECKRRGATPAFLGYQGYPAAICTSVNDVVIHGIPNKRKLRKGDIISLDCGVEYKGYYSDAALTLAVGPIDLKASSLLQVTKECLHLAFAQAKAGNRVHDISKAVFQHAKKHNYGVVREFCGHGVGFEPHEEPQIPNYVSRGPNPRLVPGMVLAIEPMINAGLDDVYIEDDQWTVRTLDGSLSAHFEHTIAIFEDHSEVLTFWE
ncbi:MAG: type I methionyl aminopeptidase [Spirochaetales bacterium]